MLHLFFGVARIAAAIWELRRISTVSSPKFWTNSGAGIRLLDVQRETQTNTRRRDLRRQTR